MGYKLATDKLVLNPNEKQFTKAYNDIDKYTETACVPDNTILGAINFGSPPSLFYLSQISHSNGNNAAYQYFKL